MEYLTGKIVRCEGETMVRRYRCFTARMTDMGGSALDLYVTNRRLILEAAGNSKHCRNLTHIETAIENVEGIKFHDNQMVEKRDNRRKLIGLALIYFLLSGVTWIVSLFLKEKFPVLFGWPAIVSILVGYGVVCLPFLYLLLRSVKQRSTTFVIVTKNLTDFASFATSEKYEGNLKLSLSAGPGTAAMLNELGALLQDLKRLPESQALAKWAESEEEPKLSRRAARARAQGAQSSADPLAESLPESLPDPFAHSAEEPVQSESEFH